MYSTFLNPDSQEYYMFSTGQKTLTPIGNTK